jgi:hypothetical protein
MSAMPNKRARGGGGARGTVGEPEPHMYSLWALAAGAARSTVTNIIRWVSGHPFILIYMYDYESCKPLCEPQFYFLAQPSVGSDGTRVGQKSVFYIYRDESRSEIKCCNPKNQIRDHPEKKWYLSQSGCRIKSGINTTFLARTTVAASRRGPRIHHAPSSYWLQRVHAPGAAHP